MVLHLKSGRNSKRACNGDTQPKRHERILRLLLKPQVLPDLANALFYLRTRSWEGVQAIVGNCHASHIRCKAWVRLQEHVSMEKFVRQHAERLRLRHACIITAK